MTTSIDDLNSWDAFMGKPEQKPEASPTAAVTIAHAPAYRQDNSANVRPPASDRTMREPIGYPCGHRRYVNTNKKGWNYCPECRRHYWGGDIVFLQQEQT